MHLIKLFNNVHFTAKLQFYGSMAFVTIKSLLTYLQFQ